MTAAKLAALESIDKAVDPMTVIRCCELGDLNKARGGREYADITASIGDGLDEKFP